MKLSIFIKRNLTIVSLFFLTTIAFSQQSNVILNESKLFVYGTSNVHDWHVEATKMEGVGDFEITQNNLQKIKNLTFTVPSESLKSGKGGMDTNTYKALKTNTYKNIQFKLINVTNVTKNTDNTFLVETVGDLTICGVTKRINQVFNVKIIGNKIVLKGKQKLDMTLFGVEPPKALLGTIKTGKLVTIEFNITFK